MTENKPVQAKRTAAKSGGGGKAASSKRSAKKPSKSKAPAKENLFFGRDESWMLFNRRVLEEAEDTGNPLMERVKFLAITASNLDEFIEIRVAVTAA